jgi:uncharacterized protein YejL (UPF0352 family)
MENILHNIIKTLFCGIFITAGINLPTIMPTGHFLECRPDLNSQGGTAKAILPTVTCEILQIGGGTLLTKGTQVLDRQLYQKIRHAEISIIKAQLTTSTKGKTVREERIEKLVLVLAQGKQTVDFSFTAGMANMIANQINDSIANSNASKFSIEIGQPAWLPQAMGWVCLAGGVLIFSIKPTLPISEAKPKEHNNSL